ncbi:MAG TPA: LEA type 2 family protein [Thermoanaerobaculia bacterium]|nr:LEA type 2 family protein [Thermoanaerobaculia bacterium]
MKGRFALAAAVFVLARPAHGETRLTCGTVDALEVTSLTRTKATAFLRTTLPVSPSGSKVFFEGKIELANTVLPVGQPVTALVQHGESLHEVVFLTELNLAGVPSELLGRLQAAALDFTLEGNLRTSSSAPPMPVCAAGVLRVGTNQIRASGPVGRDYARFGGARLAGLSLTETQGEAAVVIYNPFSFPLDVRDLVYEVRAGDRKVASGERRGVRLHAGRENSIDLPVAAGNADLAAALAGAVASGGRVEGRLVAKISVKVGKDQAMTVPLDLPGTIQVGK